MSPTQPKRHPSVQTGVLYVAENISRAMRHLISGEALEKRITAAAFEILRINDSEHFTSCMSDETLVAFREIRPGKSYDALTIDELFQLGESLSVFLQTASKDVGLATAGEDPKDWIGFTKVTDWKDEGPRPERNP